ncbi:hypothetical protein [Cryobacterium sp. M96]|uniref:hypothetical protein n=1 Tax=Cryobacterium sp. M96 TaxID=2048295 RepID=UPI0018EB7D53|nr:hypothetical protein [Cryobacterium sp. M96]
MPLSGTERRGAERAARVTGERGSALQVRVDAVIQRMHRLRQQNWPWRRARRTLSADNRTNPGTFTVRLGGNKSYPDLFQPFGGFPDGSEVVNGFITMPDLPGIGFEGKADLYAVMRQLGEPALAL